MTTKIAINGFGRIGRLIARALIERGAPGLELVAINDLTALSVNATLLAHDTVHGAFPGPITTQGDTRIDFGTGPVRVTAERDPEKLPWSDVDLVLECTGVFKDHDGASRHLENGVRKVLISAPGKGVDKTVVYGVNHDDLGPAHTIVSNASCTTNCLAPVVKPLNDAIGILRGFMTTVHAYTISQNVLDGHHKDARRARAAAENMIPTSTGAARAVGLVLPELDGKLDGVAIRVPTPNVSAVDLTFDAARDTSAEEVNSILRAAAEGPLAGILGICDAPLVSRDFNHNPMSAIVDTEQTRVLDERLVRVLAWYDNEWGFSCRMLDTAQAMAKLL